MGDADHTLAGMTGKLGRELHWTALPNTKPSVRVLSVSRGTVSGSIQADLDEDDGFPARSTSVTGTWSCPFTP